MADEILFAAIISSGDPLRGELSLVPRGGGPPVAAGETDHDLVLDHDGLENHSAIPVTVNHDRGRVIGMADRVYASFGRLAAVGRLFRDAPDAERVLRTYGWGAPWPPSVGAAVADMDGEVIAAREILAVNCRDFVGPLIVLRRWRLTEIALLSSDHAPLDPGTSLVLLGAAGAPPEPPGDAPRRPGPVPLDHVLRL